MSISIENVPISLSDWVFVEEPIIFTTLVNDTSISGISSDATYYKINDVKIDTTVSGQGNYKYEIVSEPLVVSSGIELFLHIENYYGEVLEKSYNFLFGYHVSYIDDVDWGANNNIIISALASNEVICPNTERITTYFTTREYDFVGLTSSIVPIGWANITSSIEPQTMEFLYGRTYTIEVSGIKDFSGNEIPTFSWGFTIEQFDS